MASMRAYERHGSTKTLVCLIQGLCGTSTTVELRNELVVRGKIHHVDHLMNTTLSGATLVKLNGECTYFTQIFIPGAKIRYIQIPDGINVMATIEKQVSALSVSSGHNLYQRQRMRRSKLKRHEEERQWAREHKLGRGRGRGAGSRTANFDLQAPMPGLSSPGGELSGGSQTTVSLRAETDTANP